MDIKKKTKFGYKPGCRHRLQLPQKKLKMTTYFENLTVGFNVHCVLKTCIKFCANQMLFTIRSINLFFMHSFRLQKLEI